MAREIILRKQRIHADGEEKVLVYSSRKFRKMWFWVNYRPKGDLWYKHDLLYFILRALFYNPYDRKTATKMNLDIESFRP